MRKLINVALHEFKMTAANKAFVVITILGPFLILAVSVLPGLLASKPSLMNANGKVALVGAAEPVYASLEASLDKQGWKAVRMGSEEEARAQVLSGAIMGAAILPSDWVGAESFRFLSKTGTDLALFSSVESGYAAIVSEARLAASGIDRAVLAKAMAKPEMSVEKVKAAGGSDKADSGAFMGTLFTGLAFIMFIYMTVLLYGQMLGRSVVTEKTSKTVEIMLSSVSSRELMFGKILGMGLAGIIQYAFWAAMAMALIYLVGPAFKLSLPASITMANVGALVVFFVLGFFMYSTCYAACGAAAEDEQNMAQLATPLMILIVAPMMVISAAIMNPNSPLVVGLSWFPFSAPIVMLLRVVISSPPAWEVAGSVALMIATIFLLALGSAKIFRMGILMSGKRFRLAEVIKWLPKK
jgi:ABC-2 type transport system permease protein